VELRDTEGKFWGEARAYCTGAVVRHSNKRPFKQAEPIHNMHFTSQQMYGRDADVDTTRSILRLEHRRNNSQYDKKVEDLYKRSGSKGLSEHALSGLGYWDVKMHAPFAVYHCTYLGIGKDFMTWLLVRLGEGQQPKDTVVLPFARPRDTKRILQARRQHFVLRDKPDCIMADFTQQMGNMSMSEMQLLYEVGVPYFCHDLPSFGVPQIVVVMWLLLRHAMIIFTRMPEAAGRAEYKQLLYEGRAALFAYAATAEHYHSQVENGVSQFKFTWKLHVSVAHLAHMMQDSGHAVQANDTWVERMMRHKASRSIKCVAYLLCFAICYSHTLLLPLHDTLYTCVLMQDNM
jgi:hypothetical protein